VYLFVLLCEYHVNTLILSVQLCQSSYFATQTGRKEGNKGGNMKNYNTEK